MEPPERPADPAVRRAYLRRIAVLFRPYRARLGGVLGALAKLPLDVVRGEKAGRNARDVFATEHLEIASYELLRRIAEKAGDEETATAALEIIEEEKAAANLIAENWDKFAELSLQEEGITV